MKKIKTGNRRYSKTLKRKVAQEYLSGKFSYAVGAEEYGLANRGVVKEFVKWYRKNTYLDSMTKQATVEEISKSAKEETDKRFLELEAKLKASELKVSSLETMIDVAEKKLNIDIRKKSGTKQ